MATALTPGASRLRTSLCSCRMRAAPAATACPSQVHIPACCCITGACAIGFRAPACGVPAACAADNHPAASGSAVALLCMLRGALGRQQPSGNLMCTALCRLVRRQGSCTAHRPGQGGAAGRQRHAGGAAAAGGAHRREAGHAAGQPGRLGHERVRGGRAARAAAAPAVLPRLPHARAARGACSATAECTLHPAACESSLQPPRCPWSLGPLTPNPHDPASTTCKQLCVNACMQLY